VIVNYPVGDPNLAATAVDKRVGSDEPFFDRRGIRDQLENRSWLERDLD